MTNFWYCELRFCRPLNKKFRRDFLKLKRAIFEPGKKMKPMKYAYDNCCICEKTNIKCLIIKYVSSEHAICSDCAPQPLFTKLPNIITCKECDSEYQVTFSSDSSCTQCKEKKVYSCNCNTVCMPCVHLFCKVNCNLPVRSFFMDEGAERVFEAKIKSFKNDTVCLEWQDGATTYWDLKRVITNMNKEMLSRKIRAGKYIAVSKKNQMKVGVIQKYENFYLSIRWNDQETVQEVSLTSILHKMLWVWDSSENEGETKCSEKIPAGSNFVCPMLTLQCPISYTTLKHPVTSIYGHTFERDQIHQWLERDQTCPITRKPLQANQLFPNFILKDIIQNMGNFEIRRCPENITNEIIRQVYDNNFESANRLIEGIEVSTIPQFNSWSFLYSITKIQHPEINQSILKLQDRLFKHVEGMRDGLYEINQKKDDFVSLQKQLSQERENIQLKIGECEKLLKREMSRLDEMKSEVKRQEESVRRAEGDLAMTNQKIHENHENIKQIAEMLGKCDEEFQELENNMIQTEINIQKCF